MGERDLILGRSEVFLKIFDLVAEDKSWIKEFADLYERHSHHDVRG